MHCEGNVAKLTGSDCWIKTKSERCEIPQLLILAPQRADSCRLRENALPPRES
jgi:hypothetical protein